MKRFYFLASILLLANIGFTQTTLELGDLAFVHFDRQNTPKQFSFVARNTIEANTVFYITNSDWSNSGSTFATPKSAQSIIKITTDQYISPGEVFSIDYGSGLVASATVNAIVRSGTDFEFTNAGHKIWVYQADDTTQFLQASRFITGVFWKNSKQEGDTPTPLIGSPYLFDLDINGSSVKCGCVRETLTNYSLTNIATFYTNGNWATANSAASTFPCIPTDFINAVLTASTFDIYRYGHPSDGTPVRWTQGAAAADPNTSWTDLPTGPDWASKTAIRRVEIHQNYTLDADQTFPCAALFIAPNTTLTVAPTAILAIGHELINNGKIHLKSGKVSNAVRFAQLAPTNANLGGTFIYDLFITLSEWHHFYSPINSLLTAVKFYETDSDGVIQETSGVPNDRNYILGAQGPGGSNIYNWNENNGQWNQITTSTSPQPNFSDQPYSIWLTPDVVPCVMRVEGTLKYPDQNAIITETISLNQPTPGALPGFGAPAWSNASSINGWNFYGNPYLSFYDVQSRNSNYSGLMTDAGHTVYAYQSNPNGINSSASYKFSNGTTGDAAAGQLPPFQAFFTQHVQAASPPSSPSTNNGPRASKRVRRATTPAQTIIHKRGSGVIALELFNANAVSLSRTYLHLKESMQTIGNDPYYDAVANSGMLSMFGVYHDSTCYAIKTAPLHFDSLAQKVAVIYTNHNAPFSIANHTNFDSDYESYLYDRYTNTMHNLSSGPYSFLNDTTKQDYRFDWFLASKNLDTHSWLGTSNRPWIWWAATNSGVQLFTDDSNLDRHGHVALFDVTGRKIHEGEGILHQMTLPTLPSGAVALLIIDKQIALKVQFP